MSRTLKDVTCCLLATVFAIVMSATALAGKTPPPPSAPVKYQLTWVDGGNLNVFWSELFDINNQGVAVGRIGYPRESGGSGPGSYSAIRWSEQGGIEYLDDLSTNWADLQAGLPVAGWKARSAVSINTAGQISGYAMHEGEQYWRAFLYMDGVGFYLLPTTGSIGNHFGSAINEDGDIIGTCEVNGSANDSFLFFWTPLQPSIVTSFLPGLHMGTVGVYTISNGHFTAYAVDGGPNKVYSYSVGSDGTFNYQLKSDLSQAYVIGPMSRHNSLVAFGERVFSRKGLPTDYANIYDANTNVSTRISPMGFDKSVGAVNDSGDFTFVGADGMGTFYRRLENETYRIYDLLDAAAKAELYSGTTPKSRSEIGGVHTRIDNSNVATVPTTDPFDDLVIEFTYYDNDGSFRIRAGVLTPVPLP